MKTLFETYEEISKHKDKWCYYTDRDLEIGQAWKSVAKSNSFIHTYFERGGKEVFDIKNIEYFGSEHERDIHTVSTFVLGIGIAETLEWNLVWNELFIWFLMCLYHDMGYKIEDNAKYVDKYKTLRAFLKATNVSGANNIFLKFKKRTLCENYYRYIRNEFNHIDHGVAGGVLL